MTWSRISNGSFPVPSQPSAIRLTCEERSAFCGRIGGGERITKPKEASAAKRRNRVSNGRSERSTRRNSVRCVRFLGVNREYAAPRFLFVSLPCSFATCRNPLRATPTLRFHDFGRPCSRRDGGTLVRRRYWGNWRSHRVDRRPRQGVCRKDHRCNRTCCRAWFH